MNKIYNIGIKNLRAFVLLMEDKDPLEELNISYRTLHRYMFEIDYAFDRKLFCGQRKFSNLTVTGLALYRSAKKLIESLERIDKMK